jgi:hypothetical protein
MAGAGGDAMPWRFLKTGIGPLLGERTWGGLVGNYTNPVDPKPLRQGHDAQLERAVQVVDC